MLEAVPAVTLACEGHAKPTSQSKSLLVLPVQLLLFLCRDAKAVQDNPAQVAHQMCYLSRHH